MHLYLASHLGTLDEPREGRDVRDVPEEGVWWIHPEDGRTKQVPRWEMLTKRVLSNKTNLVLYPRQAPKHSKPPMFYKYQLEFFMFDALGYKSWLETLDA